MITLEQLQDILGQEEEADTRAQQRLPDALADAIQTLHEHVGLVPSSKPSWKRPLIQDSLFQSPILPPSTTLVEYTSLPQSLQKQLGVVADGIVEIPLQLLHPANDEQKPLQGNLSNKLSEYTRGGTSTARPFRPGGIDAEDAADATVEDPFRTPIALQRSQRVLQQTTRESWIDGSLLTAPPGAGFSVGLSWSDVHDGEELERAGDGAPDHNEEGATLQQRQTTPAAMPLKNITSGSAGSVFGKGYFDDDSLFGSSSSSSEEEASDISDDEGNEQREIIPLPTAPVDLVPLVDSSNVEGAAVSDEEVDLDQLLSELTVTDMKLYKSANANPVDLAERQQQQQNDASRKSWATTKLLPIEDFQSFVPNPALAFPFTLDGFQQQAIARLERSESVFVAAHTSAGKTVVAEYAVALAMQRSTRCIYTSPIKALSNQKFRDFGRKFGATNIGLVTGDLQVNVEDATCLIMTTEILRSMLYRGADLIRDIEYVVFDEVHYVNDTERGVVWEEVIIMLPSNVNLIFLSATTPNTLEFSDWIGRTKRKPVYVVRTDYRPVPLSHFLWAGNKLHKVLQGNGSFIEKGYSEASNALLPASAKDPAKAKAAQQRGRQPTGSKHLAWQAQGSKQNWMSLVRYLDRELLTPAVIFSFSKKKCEEIARMLSSLDLNTAKERSSVQGFVLQTVARLSDNDAKLPQVLIISEMVQRGIGVHHGGLLPILKEMVEILFSRNLIKVLLATETFAMGVNMPAKAVIFNSIRKHDGIQFRILEPGEYTQMAGRAGRRSLDKVGTVILCCFGETPPPQPILRQMLTGSSMRLNSQFRLTYNMILNLLKVEEMSVEAMIKRSFSEFATQRALAANKYPQLLARGEHTLQKMEESFALEAEGRIGAEDIVEYYHATHDLLSMTKDVLGYIAQNDSRAMQDILPPGRILFLTAGRSHSVVRAPAVVLRAAMATRAGEDRDKKQDSLICAMILPKSFVPDETKSKVPEGSVGSIGNSKGRYFAIREIEIDQILFVATKKIKIDTTLVLKGGNVAGVLQLGPGSMNMFAGMKARGKKDAVDNTTKSRQAVDQMVSSLVEQEDAETSETGISRLDLRNLLKRGIDVGFFRGLCDDIDLQSTRVRSFSSHWHPNLEKHYINIERRDILQSRVETLKHLLSNESLQLFPDFLQRKAVLQSLGYIDKMETVSIKGRVACEVNTCEELIATEMVFEGVFSDLTPEEIAALLSALVFQEKNKDEELDSEIPERIAAGCKKMKQIATNLGRLQKECGLEVDPLEYCEESLKFGLVHVVYEWALGIPFKDVIALTDVQEGSIVRCITRLDELCREIRNCARVVGNPTLYRQLEAASAAIKRDIVFASSLYVS